MTFRVVKKHKPDLFGQSRSTEASKAAYDLFKVIGQTSLLINGGAATGVLALLAKDKINATPLTQIPWSLMWYGAGVIMSAVMLLFTMQTADYWNGYWYQLSYIRDQEAADECELDAERCHRITYVCFVAAMVCFIVGGVLIARAIVNVKPITPICVTD